jgi:hypothetical protein
MKCASIAGFGFHPNLQGLCRASCSIRDQAFGKAFRNNVHDLLVNQFVAPVAELFLCLNIHQDDLPSLVHYHHRQGVDGASPLRRRCSEPPDPEPCAAYREVCGEALTGERAGQPLSQEIFLIQDADVVTYAEGKTNGCDNTSSRTVLRGRRPPGTARTLLAWEPGDLQFGHLQLRGGPCREGEEP